jgi:hypothetical protein
MACCFSNYKQHFAKGQAFAYDLSDMGHYYRDYVRHMAHMDRVLPGLIHRVINEDLIHAPEDQIRALLTACGLPFEQSCLNFHETKRPVRTPSSEQVRKPINDEGTNVWKGYEAHLGPLKIALGSVLDYYPQSPPYSNLSNL